MAARVRSTTIRVSRQTREDAHAIAEATGKHLSEAVEEAVGAYRRKLFYDACREAHAQLRADRETAAAEDAEWAELDDSLADGLEEG